MTKVVLTKKYREFGENSSNKTNYGASSGDTFIDSLDAELDNYLANLLAGQDILSNDVPIKEWHSAMFRFITKFQRMYAQRLGFWNGLQDYYIGSWVISSDNNFYRCKTDNHISATAPQNDATNWVGLYNLIITNVLNGQTLRDSATIPDYANLNTYITAGVYKQASDTFAVNGTNYPVSKAGTLTVLPADSSGKIRQLYYPNASVSEVWSNVYDGNDWGGWKNINEYYAASSLITAFYDATNIDFINDPFNRELSYYTEPTINISEVGASTFYRDVIIDKKFCNSNPNVGANVSPNGFIYVLPSDTGKVGKFNPNNYETTTIGDDKIGSTNPAFNANGVVIGDYIYASPSVYSHVIKIDTSNDTVTDIGPSFGVINSPRFGDTLQAGNGLLYGMPQLETRILEINTNDDSVTPITLTGYVSGGVQSWAVSNNGFAYGAPSYAHSQVAKFDMINKTMSFIGASYGTGTYKWQEPIVAPNGTDIYCTPRDSTSILKIDTTTDTTTLIPATSGYITGKLLPDGNIYFFPYVAGKKIMRVSTVDDSITYLNNDSLSLRSSCTAPNGKVYSFGTQIIELTVPYYSSEDIVANQWALAPK